MVAVAIGGAAVLGAGASIIGGSEAAGAQENAANTAAQTQLQMYNQNRSDLAPWRAAGSAALDKLEQAYGMQPSSQPYGGFFQSPGYQWQLQQGTQAVERSAAAQGLLGSGATLKALDRYSQGLAAQDYNTYTGNLAQLAGSGQNATNTTAAAGQSAASGIAQNELQAGNAEASNYANMASSFNTGLNNVMSAYLMRGMFANPGMNPGMAIGAAG